MTVPPRGSLPWDDPNADPLRDVLDFAERARLNWPPRYDLIQQQQPSKDNDDPEDQATDLAR